MTNIKKNKISKFNESSAITSSLWYNDIIESLSPTQEVTLFGRYIFFRLPKQCHHTSTYNTNCEDNNIISILKCPLLRQFNNYIRDIGFNKLIAMRVHGIHIENQLTSRRIHLHQFRRSCRWTSADTRRCRSWGRPHKWRRSDTDVPDSHRCRSRSSDPGNLSGYNNKINLNIINSNI